MKNENGFSLMEIMVAVAIVGILAAIAIPNWVTYQNKSKQGEAKANLEGLYAAEKAFFFERGFYNPRFDGVGFNPSGWLTYRIGFSIDSGAPGSPGCFNSAAPGTCTTVLGYTPNWTENPAYAGTALTAVGTFTGTVNAANGFTAEARGDLTRGSAGSADVWTIDQNRLLQNTNTAL